MYNLRMPQLQEGYTCNGGGWWRDEWQPTMEKKVHVGDKDYWFSVDLSSNPNKILKEKEKKVTKRRGTGFGGDWGRGFTGERGEAFLSTKLALWHTGTNMKMKMI